MAMTRKIIGGVASAPPNTREVVPLLESINRRLGYLLVTVWVSLAGAAAFWVIRQAVVVAGW